MHKYYKANFLYGPVPRTPRLLIYHLHLSLSIKVIFYVSFVSSTHTQFLKNEQQQQKNTVLKQKRTDVGVLNIENIYLNFNISVMFTKGI